jgi:hypothetical protein
MANPEPLSASDIEWLKSYAAEVEATYSQRFKAESSRFKDGPCLIERFTQAVAQVLATDRTAFRAVDEAHNELCIAYALLRSSTLRFSSVCYEPRLNHCTKSIDFRADVDEEKIVFVDVKTIKPQDKDRWDQYEKAVQEGWFPENVEVLLSKDWLGGDLWHYRFASRSRMFEYTLELEQKISECKLASENTRFVLALCGDGFHWREDWLEDFVEFYFTGRHRPDDALGKAEARYLTEKGITLSRSISLFACMNRQQGRVDVNRLNWNVQPPRGPLLPV